MRAQSAEDRYPGFLRSALRALASLLIAFVMIAPSAHAQESRIASDFEISTAQKALSRERDSLLKMAAHLNLGDLYGSRREPAVARTHYGQARELAAAERLAARRRSDLNAYAIASAYLGLSEAKLGRTVEAFDAFEEAMRYAADSAKLWNLYASGMTLLSKPPKAVAAARRAVDVATRAAGGDPTPSALLDVAVYRYSLAAALMSQQNPAATGQAEQELVQVIASLESAAFRQLRDDIAQSEKFEIFSTTRSDADSYLSVMNRSRLRLARIHEERGETDRALAQLQRILELRTDDPNALTAMARLTRGTEDRIRYFNESFDANPFSTDMLREYESFVIAQRPAAPEGDSLPRQIQRAVHAYASGRYAEAGERIDALTDRLPENDAVRFLSRRLAEIQSAAVLPEFLTGGDTTMVTLDWQQFQQLASAVRASRLPPAARARLDELTFSAMATFDPPVAASETTTTLQTGSIGSVAFRFQQPTEFRGNFAGRPSLQLEFRVLGVSENGGDPTVILEPLRIR